MAGHAGPALRGYRCRVSFNRAGWELLPGCGRFMKRPYGGFRFRLPSNRRRVWGGDGGVVYVSACHSPAIGGDCYRVTARRAPVMAREVRAAAGTSALGVGGPYGENAGGGSSVGALHDAPDCAAAGLRKGIISCERSQYFVGRDDLSAPQTTRRLSYVALLVMEGITFHSLPPWGKAEMEKGRPVGGLFPGVWK